MRTIVTLIPGDGIGPEITESVCEILEKAGAEISWETYLAGERSFQENGELIPRALIESIKRNRYALKAPVTTPVGKGFKSVNVGLRQELDLFINLRPSQTLPGVKTRFDQVDIVLFRENTEGLYAGLEIYDERLGIADAIKRVTRKGSERIIRAAFDYARKHNRRKVTLVHKANILKITFGMFLEIGRTISAEYPDIQFEDVIIDNMCMQLVRNPEKYDVVVTTNLFGDILSDLNAGLVGGLGIVAGANLSEDYFVFEAVHGSAPDIAGQDKANPTALLQSAILMLEYLGKFDVAKNIKNALFHVLAQQEWCTADLGGQSGTRKFTQHIVQALQS
ncbi:MAG: NAD-dependent isocitrate dehydrogenase [Sphingobacteriia bacterium]|jgi:isocitrate dehydrogenase (NAD+)|nr:NAD-dependent isocitrate dehydrogenase [Sphingobacteriia bacterium]